MVRALLAGKDDGAVTNQSDADAKVSRYVVGQFRSGHNGSKAEQHLAECPTTRAQSCEMSNGTYGCETGCEYALLEAVMICDDGISADYEYGTFGDIADILADIERGEP